jgi:hypothetical protein
MHGRSSVATGLRGIHFHRDHTPGTRRPPLLAICQSSRARSRGARGAERSELALDGAHELWHRVLSTDPRGGVHCRERRGRRTRRVHVHCPRVSRRRRRTALAPPGGSLVTGDAGGSVPTFAGGDTIERPARSSPAGASTTTTSACAARLASIRCAEPTLRPVPDIASMRTCRSLSS